MAFEDIKENIRESAKSIWIRVRESDAYLRAHEKYESLSPAGQKMTIAGATLLTFLILMAAPYSFYAGSQSSIEDYENKRNTIRELFKVNRETAALLPAPLPTSTSDLSSLARQSLTAARLAPEQISGIAPSTATVAGISKSIDQAAIQVSLAKLNLKQIVDVGSDLQVLQGPTGTARLMGLDIKANVVDPRYYDVVYKIVAFAAKPEALPAGKSKGRRQ